MPAGPAHSNVTKPAKLRRSGSAGVADSAHGTVRKGTRAVSVVKSLVLIAAALLTLLTCAGWLDPYADAINRANSLLKEGNYDEAVRLYENSVVERPDDLTGRLNSAIALYAAGEYEDSSSRFEDVLQRIAGRRTEYPAETAALMERIARYGAGSAEFRLGFAAESLSSLAMGGQVPPSGGGSSSSGSGSSSSAGGHPSAGIGIPSTQGGSPSATGGTTLSDGSLQSSDSIAAAVNHYRRAIRHFSEALRLDPSDDDARHNYRLAYSRLSRLEQLLEQGQQGEQGDQEEKGDSESEDTQTADSSTDEGQSEEDAAEHEQSDSEEQERQDPGMQQPQEQESTESAQNQDGQQSEDGQEGQASMSPEEALRLLEMMSDEEVHGLLLRQELADESGDYLDW
ncbi:MAG: tetratricopeptide repeat protein [Firmicutes bacterium]|nr:tetratricopeptide repeat protein [Bacillota bacterium]